MAKAGKTATQAVETGKKSGQGGTAREIMEATFKALERGDKEATIAAFADDAVLFDPHYPVPDMRGKEAIRKGLDWGFGSMRQFGFVPVKVFESADGKSAAFDEFRVRYNEWGVWAVLIAGLTPFPYKVITIVSGLTGMNFVAFMLCSVIARAARFFIVAALLWKFGAPIRDFIERRLGLMFTIFILLLLGGFFLVKYL